jgi:PIN domain nuclease of toxin-antitoxin system
MKLLLDTHTFLWFVNGDANLRMRSRQAVEDLTNERLLSIASVWEMAIKSSTGKLRFDAPFDTFITEQLYLNQIILLPMTIVHTARVIALPFFHRDPFDRLLISQALEETLTLVSIDQIFDAYGVNRLW